MRPTKLLCILSCLFVTFASAAGFQLSSPDGSVHFKIGPRDGRLIYSISLETKPVIESSVVQFTLDGVEITAEAEVGEPDFYQLKETYPWYGVHSIATNHFNGAKVQLKHHPTQTRYFFEVRAFDNGAAFRIIVPGEAKSRAPDESTTFMIPMDSFIWSHDLEGHYEDVHVRRPIGEMPAEEWAAPPVTFKLPSGVYAAITEAALVNYSGMALQADGHRGLRVRLGHSHPPSYPYRLRYSKEDIERLSKPAAISGPITTPWRVVMMGRNLNALVNSDIVHNLCLPPDPILFPKGTKTQWIRPGRAVWRYLDGGGDNSVTNMIEFTRLAAELGFEHHVIEGFWSRWSDAEMKQLMDFAKEKQVGIWLWKHSRSLRDPQARKDFLKRCHDFGVAGAKVDFFDHEAKEVIDLYQALLREAAEYRLLLNFHGANKPAGEARTWPNELTREAIRGMEASRLTNRAAHNVTLPFTRMLAGQAEYTPMHFGQRRHNTTWGHQIASAAVLATPLLTYAASPMNILTNPCVDVIKSIPSVWDETVVLPPSEIGEIAVFARRSGKVWFLAILNGTTARKIEMPLTFLGRGDYQTTLLRDLPDETSAQTNLNRPMQRGNALTIELRSGGGFVGRFRPE